MLVIMANSEKDDDDDGDCDDSYVKDDGSDVANGNNDDFSFSVPVQYTECFIT